jgi:CRP-like cAMP-binding protein
LSHLAFSLWSHFLIKTARFENETQLEKTLSSLPLLSYLPSSDLQHLVKHSKILDFPSGTRVIVQGEVGKHMFVLLSGGLRVQRRESRGWVQPLGDIDPVSLFGEVAIIEDVRRTAEVITRMPSKVLCIPSEQLKAVARKSIPKAELSQFFHSILVNQFFTSSPLFRNLNSRSIEPFLIHGEMKEFDKNEVIFRQGSLGDSFYLLIRGRVRVLVNQMEVNQIHQGGCFGEIALIADVPRTATIVAADPCVTLKLSQESLWEILAENMELAVFIEELGEKRLQQDVDLIESLDWSIAQ